MPKSDTAQNSLKLMNVERQSRDTLYRMEYDFDTPSGEVRPLGSGEGANPTAAPTREQQAFAAWKETLNWEERILENIAHRYNLEHACQRVKSNKGAPGIDGMTVEELERWLGTIWQIINSSNADWKPPYAVIRTYGGVRGGRKSPYSIIQARPE